MYYEFYYSVLRFRYFRLLQVVILFKYHVRPLIFVDEKFSPDFFLKLFSATHMSSDPPISRHFLYAKHFPLCQDDTVSQHDTNQRYILLFGVGKERDEKKHAVKKMSKGNTPTKLKL